MSESPASKYTNLVIKEFEKYVFEKQGWIYILIAVAIITLYCFFLAPAHNPFQKP